MAWWIDEFKRPVCQIGLHQEFCWNRWGLSIDLSVWLGDLDYLRLAVHSHNLVSRYLEEHPLEIEQLFNESGHVKYYDVLDRAELTYD